MKDLSTGYRVIMFNWVHPQTKESGWRAEINCQICSSKQMLSAPKAPDQTLEEAIKRLKIFLERPVCDNCEEKLKKYTKADKN